LEEVAGHYLRAGGRSPINDQNRALLAALRAELAPMPVYWGNRNWHPYLADALRRMRADGVRTAICFVTSAYASYSGCRQYRENLADALAEVGSGAPRLDKLRHYFDHPGFVLPMVDRVRDALAAVPADQRAGAHLVFTAHSIPLAQAEASGPTGGAYPRQLRATARAIVDRLDPDGARPWELVWQSRSGSASVPWLEPDVVDHLQTLHAKGVDDVVLVPIGFVSDHMEVVHDLDVEAARRAGELGVRMVRAGTVGTDPRFVRMVRELVEERRSGAPRLALSPQGPSHDVCPPHCCAPRVYRPAAAGTPQDLGTPGAR
ncbi:MAG TPA: ferrochelatase, partial [Frankiaceae bacterium]|nr:ferrochelatase [Frankiaceae bacterium]